MAFSADSPLAKKVVVAAHGGKRPGGNADIRAICIHMAEGGGTASWLSHDHGDGNSSHYVVEYAGSVVQMVPEIWWAGSIKPSLLRMNDDAVYPHQGESVVYGRTSVVAAMGTTAANDPNRYVIAIEVEGFARKAPIAGKKGFDARANPGGGPNAKQRAALRTLVDDIRKRHGTPYPCLGHRDFQSYKPCPGRHIAWADYGGHAAKANGPAHVPPAQPPVDPPVPPPADPPIPPPPHLEVPMESFTIPSLATVAKVKTDAFLYDNSSLAISPTNIRVQPGREMPLIGLIGATAGIVDYVDAAGTTTHKAYWVKAADIEATHPAP